MTDFVRAKVELVGCQSHTARGRTFKKGQPQTITNADDVAYYQASVEYAVTLLEAAPKKKAKPAPVEVEEPTVEETAEEENDGAEGVEEDKGDEGAPKKKTKKRKSRA
jgi:hypothetical protein